MSGSQISELIQNILLFFSQDGLKLMRSFGIKISNLEIIGYKIEDHTHYINFVGDST